MKVKFINHACAILESGDCRIMTDPWLEGKVFDNGWSLIDDSVKVDDKDFDYVWLSHEHPDHFTPSAFCKEKISNSKKIILQNRRNDEKLKNFFCSKGYEALIIPDDEQLILKSETHKDIQLLGGLSKDFDSWLSVFDGKRTILNLNDCVAFDSTSKLRQIKAAVGKVDVLMVQFSFANWTGNQGDDSVSRRARTMLLNGLQDIFNIIEPEYIIPFASFSYFSHVENVYLNHHGISVRDVLSHFPNEAFIVMKPGDTWVVGEAWKNNNDNEEFWRQKRKKAIGNRLTRTSAVSFKKLHSQFQKMKNFIESKNNLRLLKEEILSRQALSNTKIYISDLDICVAYDIFSGFYRIDFDKKSCDISVSSESLYNVMKNPWGFGTLMINGRFQANYSTFSNFVIQTRLYYMNNIGKYYPEDVSVSDIINSSSLVKKLVEIN